MRSLKQRLRDFTLPLHAIMRMTGLAAAASLPAALVWWASAALPLIVTAILVISVFAAAYLGLAAMLSFEELGAWTGRFRRR